MVENQARSLMALLMLIVAIPALLLPLACTNGSNPGTTGLVDDPPPQAGGRWPGFRGVRASGVAAGSPPLSWSVETGNNVAWRTPIPGLGHSSPVVWDDRVFVTSAVSDNPEPYLRIGLYGESPDNPEEYIHHFRLYCLSLESGEILWERTAHSGIP